MTALSNPSLTAAAGESDSPPIVAGAALPETLSFDTAAFDRFLERVAPTASSGRAAEPIRRREASIVIFPEMCEPGAFSGPLKVCIRSLTSEDELNAMRNATTETSVGHTMAKRSIVSVNGRNLLRHEVDLLWEVLGFAGRTAVANAFLQHCTGANDVLLGKSLQSVEVS